MDNVQTNLSPDANNRIMKVANGLQSEHLGVKCEAIAEFSCVIKKYPFPVIISPLFVRIVEAFKNGPNYLRLVILKNCEACKEHLGKINCAAEIINMLSQNMDSNDPCSRAICLKLLGLLHPIFNNNKLIHHMIMLCLDSHYDIELNAAVEASNYYAPVSNEFSTALCPKLCSQLESLSTDLTLKLQFIKLAKYLHHEADTYERTRSCLISLLNGYQSLEFVVTLLNTLTLLATKSSIHARSQIDILLAQLDIEERDEAIIAVLNNSLILARAMAHVWSEEHVDTICRYYNKCDLSHDMALQASCKMIELLSVLAQRSCPVVVGDNCHRVIECASKAALTQCRDTEIVYKINCCGVCLLSMMAQTRNDVALAQHTLNTYGVNVATLWRRNRAASFPDIVHSNAAVAALISKFPTLAGDFVTQCVSDVMAELRAGVYCTNEGFTLLCRFVAQLCGHNGVSVHLPRASAVVDAIHRHGHRRSTSQVLSVCALLFQLVNCEGGALLSVLDTGHVIDWIEQCGGGNVSGGRDCWLMYRVARSASRYNQHNIAARLYAHMWSSTVVSAKYKYWLRGLQQVSEAESVLMCLGNDDDGSGTSRDVDNTGEARDDNSHVTRVIAGIVQAQQHLLRGTTSLKCAGITSSSFHDSYISIRCEFLTAVYTLLVTLNQYATKFASDNPNFVVLIDSKQLFETNVTHIADLISASIDADHVTIGQLQWLKRLSSVFVCSLHAVVSDYYSGMDIVLMAETDNAGGGGGGVTCSVGHCHQHYWLTTLCRHVTDTLVRATDRCQQHTVDKIRLLTTLAINAVRIGVPLPRFVFQKLQHSEVRLVAILNSKTITNETVSGLSLRQDQSHKLQVFGVIEQRCKLAKLVRLVTQVRISVTIVMASASGASKLINQRQVVHEVSNEVLKLNNDYFSTHILLDLKQCTAGKYHLIMKAIPIDSSGTEWQIKDVLVCLIKVECGAANVVSGTGGKVTLAR